MIRNEADIVRPFIGHCVALFDHIYVVDHNSIDGTRELLAEAKQVGAPLTVWNYRFHGQYQAPILNAVARYAFDEGADWLCLLDADEFLAVQDRADLERLLSASQSEVCYFRWRNLAPQRFGRFESFDVVGEYFVRTQPSPYQKVAISRALLKSAPAFHIGAGTHSVARTPLGGDLRGKPIGVIYHIPIRSLDRLSVKIRAAVAALRAKRGRGLTETFHWFELENAILHGRLDEAALRRIALSYGEPLNLAAEWPECETISWNLPLAGVPLLARAKSMGEVEVGNSAVQWAHWSLATGDVDTIAVVKTDHITLQRAPLGKRLLGAMLRMYSWIRGVIRKLRSASG